MIRPLVALVGRPNVGKSTLFNRIAGRRLAIVEDVPGVTRDRHYADVDWDDRAFAIVDTGGLDPGSKDPLLKRVREQAQLAMEEAAAVVLVLDGREGVTGIDEAVAEPLRRSGKPVFLAVNKIDVASVEGHAPLAEFHHLGLGEVFPLSAEHGRGVSDLLEALMLAIRAPPAPAPPEEAPELPEEDESELPGDEEEPLQSRAGVHVEELSTGPEGLEAADVVKARDAREEETARRPVRIAIVGRPNVGKSTFVNTLLGEERFVVSDVPGTTRDAIDSVVERGGRRFVVTDTAGIRRKSAIAQRVEAWSVVRAMRSIEEAEVVAFMLDATEAAVEQDARLLGMVAEKGRALVILVNKWDLAEREGATQAWYRTELARRLPFVSWAPMVFTSGKTGKNVEKVLATAARMVEQHRARFPTHALNDLLTRAQAAHPAPLTKGRPVKLYYVAQVAFAPPTFVIHCNRPDAVGEGYRRYVENRFREAFGLEVPLRIVYKERQRRARPPGGRAR